MAIKYKFVTNNFDYDFLERTYVICEAIFFDHTMTLTFHDLFICEYFLNRYKDFYLTELALSLQIIPDETLQRYPHLSIILQ